MQPFEQFDWQLVKFCRKISLHVYRKREIDIHVVRGIIECICEIGVSSSEGKLWCAGVCVGGGMQRNWGRNWGRKTGRRRRNTNRRSNRIGASPYKANTWDLTHGDGVNQRRVMCRFSKRFSGHNMIAATSVEWHRTLLGVLVLPVPLRLIWATRDYGERSQAVEMVTKILSTTTT